MLSRPDAAPAVARFDAAMATLPLVAILRGIRPVEVQAVAAALYEQGFRLIEVPLNSPDALVSVATLARCLPADALVGAGTVLDRDAVRQVEAAGAQLVVMPHTDATVVAHAAARGLVCVPGAATPTEVLAAVAAGACAVKLFPAELVTPAVVKAMRAVLPPALQLLPVGGITPSSMNAYRRCGASGFGLGSALYAPGMPPDEVACRARAFVQAWQVLSR